MATLSGAPWPTLITIFSPEGAAGAAELSVEADVPPALSALFPEFEEQPAKDAVIRVTQINTINIFFMF